VALPLSLVTPIQMIGVVLPESDLKIAEEFFELFKTPWEQAVPRRKYPVVLSTSGLTGDFEADLFLVYGSGQVSGDREAGFSLDQSNGPADISWGATQVPIYGRHATFGAATGNATLMSDRRAADYRARVATRNIWRIGYDLFEETRHLLTNGQPANRASTPTLELHIALLRHMLLESGIAFLEVPPRPEGSDFICCLTHDVDFFGIRRHKFDRTLAGFVGRASFKTLADLIRGRRRAVQAARNWMALLSLPFVFLKMAPDFWRPFDDYARAENGSRSTFFLVPFKGQPGLAPDGTVHSTRAVPYGMRDIREEMSQAASRGSELAVHGIDAWRDADAGRREMRELASTTGPQPAGVRMHWLYFAPESPRQLEAAGFNYDSTWGYNDAVGYRPGTSQVFRLPETKALMELPLSIMDSALFYPTRMNRSEPDAMLECRQIVDNARRFGGTVVINWHDRSLAPERLWDRPYKQLLDEVGKGDRAWFATGAEAVDWFRWRRSTRFTWDTNSRVVTVTAPAARQGTPAGRLRISRPAGTNAPVLEERRLDGEHAIGVQL